MALGSSMLATIRTAPPQWAQVVMSMEGPAEPLRPAHRTALCSGLRGSIVGANVGTGAASPAGRPAAPQGVAARAGLHWGEYAVEAG